MCAKLQYKKKWYMENYCANVSVKVCYFVTWSLVWNTYRVLKMQAAVPFYNEMKQTFAVQCSRSFNFQWNRRNEKERHEESTYYKDKSLYSKYMHMYGVCTLQYACTQLYLCGFQTGHFSCTEGWRNARNWVSRSWHSGMWRYLAR